VARGLVSQVAGGDTSGPRGPSGEIPVRDRAERTYDLGLMRALVFRECEGLPVSRTCRTCSSICRLTAEDVAASREGHEAVFALARVATRTTRAAASAGPAAMRPVPDVRRWAVAWSEVACLFERQPERRSVEVDLAKEDPSDPRRRGLGERPAALRAEVDPIVAVLCWLGLLLLCAGRADGDGAGHGLKVGVRSAGKSDG
jgi:hypothetical protein